LSAFLRRFDPYTLAGVLVLAAASAILVLLMVSSRVVIFSSPEHTSMEPGTAAGLGAREHSQPGQHWF